MPEGSEPVGIGARDQDQLPYRHNLVSETWDKMAQTAKWRMYIDTNDNLVTYVESCPACHHEFFYSTEPTVSVAGHIAPTQAVEIDVYCMCHGSHPDDGLESVVPDGELRHGCGAVFRNVPVEIEP